MMVSEQQLDRWTALSNRLGYSTPAEWARVTLLRASRDGFDGNLEDSEELKSSALIVHLTEDEHAELDRADFSAWAREVLDTSAHED